MAQLSKNQKPAERGMQRPGNLSSFKPDAEGTMDPGEMISHWKKDVLSRVCSACQGRCCHTNLGPLSKEQAELIAGHANPPLITKLDENSYMGYFFQDGCPQFKGSRCNIHENPLRPKDCADFPLKIDYGGKSLVILGMRGCPATSPENIGGLCQWMEKAGFAIMCQY